MHGASPCLLLTLPQPPAAPHSHSPSPHKPNSARAGWGFGGAPIGVAGLSVGGMCGVVAGLGWGAGVGMGTQYINVSPEFTEGKQHRCGVGWLGGRLEREGSREGRVRWLGGWPPQLSCLVLRARPTSTLNPAQAQHPAAGAVRLQTAEHAAEHAGGRVGRPLTSDGCLVSASLLDWTAVCKSTLHPLT